MHNEKTPIGLQNLIFAGILLTLVTAGLYWPTLNFEFLNYDDPRYVSANSIVQRGITLEGIGWAFKSAHVSNWHPLTWISHMLDCQLFGLNPMGPHAVNVLFHIMNTLLLLTVLAHMTGRLWTSALVAALFAVHPQHVESVAWIAERKDVLSTFFWLLTMGAYARWCRDKGLRLYIGMLGCFILGLLSKPMLVTLPFVLLLLDYWPLERLPKSPVNWDLKGRLKEKLPLFAFSALSCWVTFMAQHQGGAVSSIRYFPLAIRLQTAIKAYAVYVLKLYWPTPLSALYPHPGKSLPLPEILFCALIIIILTACAVMLARRARYVLVGWLWYLGTLVPVIGLVQVGGQAYADRYTYVPFIGLFIILAWTGLDLWKRYQPVRPLLIILSGMAICGYSFLTYQYLPVWKDSISLFSNAIQVTDNNSVAYNNLGTLHESAGELDQAIDYYTKASEATPYLWKPHSNRGRALAKQGKMDLAIIDFQKALEINSSYVPAHSDLANTYVALGRLEDAALHYEAALKLEPSAYQARLNAAAVYISLEQPQQSLTHYGKALELRPNNPTVLFRIGNVMAKFGRPAQSIPYYEEAVKQQPNFPEAHNFLGDALDKTGNIKRATAHFREALKLNPHYFEAASNLGVALAKQGKHEEALRFYQLAIRIQPDYAEAYNNMGVTLVQMRQFERANEAFHKALAIKPNYSDVEANLGQLKKELNRMLNAASPETQGEDQAT